MAAQLRAADIVTEVNKYRLDSANIRNPSVLASTFSNMVAPAVAATARTSMNAFKLGINGSRTVTTQAASVSYMSVSQLLVIPAGLGDAITPQATAEKDVQENLWTRLTELVNPDPNAVLSGVYPHLVLQNPNVQTAWLETWGNAGAEQAIPGANPTDAAVDVPNSISITVDHGTINPLVPAQIIPRLTVNEASTTFITIAYGAAAAQTIFIEIPVPAGEADAPTLFAAMNLDGVKSQVLNLIAPDLGHNFNAVDYAILADATMRWTDDMCQTIQPVGRFQVRLTEYSLASVAALNLSAVNGSERLAWCRSYDISVGLLPATTSNHNVEYQWTEQMSSEDAMKNVLDAHPDGEEGQRYLRGCISLTAGFGYLHLSNNHTYQLNNDPLLRKAKAIIKACRTTLLDGEVETLCAEGMLPFAVRVAVHCFGLSATWGMFRSGQHHQFLSEPLQIRLSAMPPDFQKLGIVMSELAKILAIPIGSKIRVRFADAIADLNTLHGEVVDRAANYSVLAKHYGYNSTALMTPEHTLMVKSLLPMCAGFAAVFGTDAEGNAIGSSLSQVYENIRNSEHTLCAMYEECFATYLERSTNLEELLGIAATPLAIANAAGRPGNP